jgi:hypothetical protein
MTLHKETFNYLKPTDAQMLTMMEARMEASRYADFLDALLPDSPDKTYLLRKLREVAMWVNIALTRNPDGSPRT